jgi:hypothetical protein
MIIYERGTELRIRFDGRVAEIHEYSLTMPEFCIGDI